MSLNRASLLGRLGSDPKLGSSKSGQPVCNFTLATNENWVDKSGQKQERTEWHRIVVWGKQAEICAKYLHKGRELYLDGKIQTRKWTDDEGTERYTTEILMDRFYFIGGNSNGGGSKDRDSQDNQGNQAEQYNAPHRSDFSHSPFGEPDLPF